MYYFAKIFILSIKTQNFDALLIEINEEKNVLNILKAVRNKKIK